MVPAGTNHVRTVFTGKYIYKIVLTLKVLFAGYSIHGFQLSFSMGLPKLYLSGFFQSDLI